jgi:hypothetical protein
MSVAEDNVTAGNSLALVAAGVRVMAGRWPQAAALWAVSTALAWGTMALQAAGGSLLKHATLSPSWLGFEAFSLLSAGILSALGYRLFLSRGRDWLRFDRAFWVGAGLLALASAGVTALGLVNLAVHPVRPAGAGALRGAGFGSLSSLAGQLFLYWVYARLLLWPLSRLDPTTEGCVPSITPRRSFALMAGYVGPYLIAMILISLPGGLFTIAYFIAAPRGVSIPDHVQSATWVLAAISPGLSLLGRAMAAVVYWARRGPVFVEAQV